MNVRQIHQEALNHFEYLADSGEHWDAPDEIKAQISKSGVLHGDCDDFAAYCVMRCRECGIPARFVFCLCENGGGHLVCESDGWILDNRQPMVCRQDDLPYQWVSISGFKPGDPWHLIKE